MQSLYRKEALSIPEHRWLGETSVSQPLSIWLGTAISLAIASAVVVFILKGSYTQRHTVAGELAPINGLSSATSPSAGIIREMLVKEGDSIRKGQPIAEIGVSPRISKSQGNVQELVSNSLDHKVAIASEENIATQRFLNSQLSMAHQRHDSIKSEISSLRTELAIRKQQSALATVALEKLATLEGTGYVADFQLRQYKDSAFDHLRSVASAERQIILAERALQEALQEIRTASDKRSTASLEYERQSEDLKQQIFENETLSTLTINSPSDGTIATVLRDKNQTVELGQNIVKIIPGSGELEARLLVPSSAMGFLREGGQVQIRYDSYPYQKFGVQLGTISRISRASIATGELGLLTQATATTAMYFVSVRLSKQSIRVEGKDVHLRPGMGLSADLIGENRSLLSWMFSPAKSIQR